MFWVASGGSQNIKGLNVGHWRCRKSDMKIKHPIKLPQPAKCNNRAAGTGLSIRGQPDGQTEDSQTQPWLGGRQGKTEEHAGLCPRFHQLNTTQRDCLMKSIKISFRINKASIYLSIYLKWKLDLWTLYISLCYPCVLVVIRFKQRWSKKIEIQRWSPIKLISDVTTSDFGWVIRHFKSTFFSQCKPIGILGIVTLFFKPSSCQVTQKLFYWRYKFSTLWKKSLFGKSKLKILGNLHWNPWNPPIKKKNGFQPPPPS